MKEVDVVTTSMSCPAMSKELTKIQSVQSPRIAALDGFRAVAILIVLAYHYAVIWAPPYQAHSYYPYGNLLSHIPLLDYGWAGVEFFFVISGFVILFTLERCSSLIDFLSRRVARLWPGMIFCATVTALAVNGFGPSEWRVAFLSWVSSVLFIRPDSFDHLLHGHLSWVDGSYWTLWVEIRFYAVAAIMFLIARKLIKSAVMVLLLSSFLLHWAGQSKILNLAKIVLVIEYMPYFCMGCFFYFRQKDGVWRLYTLIGIAMSLSMAIFSGYYFWGFRVGNANGFAIANIIIVIFFIMFIHEISFIKLFESRPIVMLGEASYSLYLLHQVLGISLMGLFNEVFPPLASLLFTLMTILAISFFSFYYVEIPGKRLILKLTRPAVILGAKRMPWLTYRHNQKSP